MWSALQRAGGRTLQLADQGVNLTLASFSQVILPDSGLMAHSNSYAHRLSEVDATVMPFNPQVQGITANLSEIVQTTSSAAPIFSPFPSVA